MSVSTAHTCVHVPACVHTLPLITPVTRMQCYSFLGQHAAEGSAESIPSSSALI